MLQSSDTSTVSDTKNVGIITSVFVVIMVASVVGLHEVFFFVNNGATGDYTPDIVGSVRCVEEAEEIPSGNVPQAEGGWEVERKKKKNEQILSLIQISEPTRRHANTPAVFRWKKKTH